MASARVRPEEGPAIALRGHDQNILRIIATCLLSSPRPRAFDFVRYVHERGISRACTVVIGPSFLQLTQQLTALAVSNGKVCARGEYATNRWFKLTLFTTPALLSHHTPKMPQN